MTSRYRPTQETSEHIWSVLGRAQWEVQLVESGCIATAAIPLRAFELSATGDTLTGLVAHVANDYSWIHYRGWLHSVRLEGMLMTIKIAADSIARQELQIDPTGRPHTVEFHDFFDEPSGNRQRDSFVSDILGQPWNAESEHRDRVRLQNQRQATLAPSFRLPPPAPAAPAAPAAIVKHTHTRRIRIIDTEDL